VGRYEQLRAVALAGAAGGHGLGLGLVVTRGLPAWMAAWQTVPTLPAAASVATSTPAAVSPAVVAVLAAMTIGLLQATQAKGAS
jgi:hypothetical protein